MSLNHNVHVARAVHAAFNARDYARVAELCAPAIEYTDHPRGITLKSAAEYEDYMQEWSSAFPDGCITDAEYEDAGSVVICEFMARGTNTGRYGPFEATGQRVAVPMCEVLRFNADGLVVSGDLYYDQLAFLTEMGLFRLLPV